MSAPEDRPNNHLSADVVRTLVVGLQEIKELAVHVQYNAQNIAETEERIRKLEQALFYANGHAFSVRLQRLEETEQKRKTATEATIKGRWAFMTTIGPSLLGMLSWAIAYVVGWWLGK